MVTVLPVQNKKFPGDQEELTEVAGTDEEAKSHLHEFGKSCDALSWNHCTQRHTDRKQNGIAERALRRVREGTSAVMWRSGLENEWWADSMECYYYLRNIQDLLSGGKTPYERRFGMPFNGSVIPSGAMVEYHTISAKYRTRLQQFGPKVLPGKFLGYASPAGEIWKGDILNADIENWSRWTHLKSLTPMKGENFKCIYIYSRRWNN